MASATLARHKPAPDVLAKLGKRSAALRAQRAQLRRQLRSGELRLVNVLNDPPAFAEDQLLYELLLQQGHFGPEKLRRLNLRAIGAGVNLAQPLGHASKRTREWLARELRESGR